jgi:hypothetical protein
MELARGISVVRDALEEAAASGYTATVVASMQVSNSTLFTTMACTYTCRAPENARESTSTLRMTNNSIKAYQICSPHVRGKTNSFAQ